MTAEPKSSASNANAVLGGQLGWLNYYGHEVPFIDQFKLNSGWSGECADEWDDPGCKKTMSDDEIKQKLFEQDANGWIKSIPKRGTNPKQYNSVGTIFLWNGGFKPGRYILTYDGEGVVEASNSAKKNEALSKPNRQVYDIPDTTVGNSGLKVAIKQTDPNGTGNYIRNIKFFREDQESLLKAGEIFNPDFINIVKPFKFLRAMSWMATNDGNEQKNWDDLVKITDYNWAGQEFITPSRKRGGAPIDVLTALANKTSSDLWLNIPHQATDDYVTKFAQKVKETLDPKLNVYIEYSNEVWNWSPAFSQSHWAVEQAKARWGEDKPDRGADFNAFYGMRASQVINIWKSVFGNQADRVKGVMATQTAWKGLEENRLQCVAYAKEEKQPPCYKSFDLYAITGYFGAALSQPENADTVKKWMREPDGGYAKALNFLRTGQGLGTNAGSLPDVQADRTYHKGVADRYGLKLVTYEGGPDFVSQDKEIQQWLNKLRKRPELKELYTEFLNDWKNKGGSLYSHHVIMGGGEYSAVDGTYVEDPNTSAVYQALLQFKEKTVSKLDLP
ncbi:MAG TPA: cellulose-binding protein [Coleofasciculaceae cyanobacterium]